MARLTERELIKTISKTPPANCTFKVGDIVTFTNENGILFKDRKIIGFDDNPDNNRTVYLSKDSYWFPVTAESLTQQ